MIQEAQKRLKEEALKHLDALWQTALWLTKDEAKAEKVVEDAYIEASKTWDGATAPADGKFQIFKIMIGIFEKENKIDFDESVSEEIENAYEPFPTDRISAILNLPKDVIARSIQSIPLVNRLVITLSIFQEFTYQQIAEVIGASRKAVALKIYEGYLLIHHELNKHMTCESLSMSTC